MAGLWKALGYTLLDWCLYPHELVMGFCQILYPPPLFFFLHFQGPKACWAPGNPGHPDSRSSHHLFLATQPGINPSSVTIVLASETNFKHSTGGGPVKLYMNLLAPGIIQHYCQVSDLLHLLHPNHLQGKVDSEIPACSEKTMEAICSGWSKEE